MSCTYCGCEPCCSPVNCAELSRCACSDPGSVEFGRYASVLDYRLCAKRLANVAGILVNQIDGSGNGYIRFTSSPCVVLPELEIADGVGFGSIMASLGDLGCWQSLVPTAGSTGYLQAIGGEWKLTAVPTATIPSNLPVTNLTVTDTATIVNLLVTGSFCFPAVGVGTIATVVGLNAAGCLVKQTGTGSILNLSFALYYENPTETSVATPNNAIANAGYAIIGNEIFDNNSIAQVQSTQSVEILVAGKYMIFWSGFYGDPPTVRDAGLNLEINGGTPIPGFGPGRIRSLASGERVTFTAFGFTIRQLAVNDVLKLQCQSSVATSNPLRQVKLMLLNFAS